MGKFFDDIKAGLEEAIEFEKGKTTLRTRTVELPTPPEQYASGDVKRIREEKHLSQSIFAMWLNVSVKTVRSWESGERIPSHAALRLLELIDKGIYHPKMHRKSA
ncbi:MAG: helix-turn-helix domain-containing protein [Verrucomicrobia bacterium]|nr:helix-turn-helix domain-containing protein [Verrucomicrobiota bacterium]